MALDLPAIRRQFPYLSRKDKQTMVYLDSAATAQKPQAVLTAMDTVLREQYGNPHRGLHPLADAATTEYEMSRKTVASFVNAKPEEIIFTRNATEAINLVARTYGDSLDDDDAVAITLLEHHSNIVPWHQLHSRTGTEVRWIPITDDGEVRMEDVAKVLEDKRVKLLSISACSNVLGTMPDLQKIISKAHDAGALVLVDAAQVVAHSTIDMRALDCDFLVFSGHKLYGPTGIGVLYAKRDLLQSMPPFLGGGMMIGEVTTDHFTCADLSQKFEAGTPAFVEAVGLAAAIEWISQFSMKDIAKHESELIEHAIKGLKKIPGVKILGSQDSKNRSSCVSFVCDGVHPHDLTDIVGQEQICLRAGHHCAEPLHRHLGISASTRLSVGIYNTIEEIDAALAAITRALTKLRG